MEELTEPVQWAIEDVEVELGKTIRPRTELTWWNKRSPGSQETWGLPCY
jgi:hypothetical protein